MLHFLDGNLSDIEGLVETDDEVEDSNWTPNAEHDDESSSSNNEQDRSIDRRTESGEGDRQHSDMEEAK